MTEENTTQQEAQPVEQGLQQANSDSLAKQDPSMEGIQQPIKIEGVAVAKKEAVKAPVAAPKQQIAPVSANGENTSSRESPKTEIPPEMTEVSQKAGVSEDNNPSADEANPPVEETLAPSTEEESEEQLPPEGAEIEQQPEQQPEQQQEQEVVEEVPFDELTPLEQADVLLDQIPGKMRLY